MRLDSWRRAFGALLFASLSSLVAGCSNETAVTPQAIDRYGDYRVIYDEPISQLTLVAQLRNEGPNGDVDLDGSISVNGDTLSEGSDDDVIIDMDGTFLFEESSISTPGLTYSFEWTRSDGSVVKNVVPMATPIEITSPNAESFVFKEEGFTVFTNAGVGPNGRLFCIVDGAATITSGWLVGQDDCIFSPADVADLPPGQYQAKAYVELGSGEPKQGHDALGGRLSSVWGSPVATFTLSP